MISNLKNLVYNLDKFNNSYSNTVKLKQNDIRTLEIHVYENGEELDLTGYTAVVKWVNANNTVAPLTTSNIEIKNNTIFVKMIADCTRSSGVAKWELVLSKNDSIDYSFTQEIKILSSVEQGQEESKNVSTLLEDVTKAQEEATKFVNTYGNLYGIKDKVDKLNNTKAEKKELDIVNSRIDSFTHLAEGSTTGDAELIDARIMVDGIKADTLGDALRKQILYIKQLHETKQIRLFRFESMNGSYNNTELTLNNNYGSVLKYDISDLARIDSIALKTTVKEYQNFCTFLDGENKVISYIRNNASTQQSINKNVLVPIGTKYICIGTLLNDVSIYKDLLYCNVINYKCLDTIIPEQYSFANNGCYSVKNDIRCSTKMLFFDKDVKITMNDGFNFGVNSFKNELCSNDTFTNDSGWVSSYKIKKGTYCILSFRKSDNSPVTPNEILNNLITSDVKSYYYTGVDLGFSRHNINIENLCKVAYTNNNRGFQGFDIYNNVIIQALGGNGLRLIDINTGTDIGAYYCNHEHGNTLICANNVLEGEVYPRIFSSGEGDNQLLYENRITNTSATLIARYKFDNNDFYKNYYIDFENKLVYSLGYATNSFDNPVDNFMIIRKYDMNKVSVLENGLCVFEEINNSKLPFISTHQGGKIFNNKLFVFSSTSDDKVPSRIVVIDLATYTICSNFTDFPIEMNNECEDLAIVKNEFGTYDLVTSTKEANNVVYRKIIF